MNCFIRCRAARIHARELRGEIVQIDDLMRRLSPGIASEDGVRPDGREDIAELVARKADRAKEWVKAERTSAREAINVDKALEGETNERRKIFCVYFYKYARSTREAAQMADVRVRTAYRWRAEVEKKN